MTPGRNRRCATTGGEGTDAGTNQGLGFMADPDTLLQIEACQTIGTGVFRQVAHFIDQCGVPFFLDAGTLLGAYRHGGWIPWDDDIDLVMFRADYEVIRDNRHLLPNDLRLTDAEISREHVTQIPRIGYLPSGLEWEDRWGIRPPERQRIVVDIFLIDSDIDPGMRRRLRMAVSRLLQVGIAMRGTTARLVRQSTDGLVATATGLSVLAIARAVPRKWLQRGYLVLARMGGKDSPLVIILNHPSAVRSVAYPRSLFTERATQLSFDGEVYRCPDPEPFLEGLFGPGFLQPPPLADRKPHMARNFWARYGDRQWGLERGN